MGMKTVISTKVAKTVIKMAIGMEAMAMVMQTVTIIKAHTMGMLMVIKTQEMITVIGMVMVIQDKKTEIGMGMITKAMVMETKTVI